ncbi:hypothetical protein ACT3CD_12800 [Geofilum sp. OHC36d9]|uniref:hypothetical protein n=1 Tax=Geofilum sp. OHC36d9 TaxID=3458413 RepID=UPI0040339CF0
MVRSVMDDLLFFHYDKGSRAQKVVVDLLKKFRVAIQTEREWLTYVFSKIAMYNANYELDLAELFHIIGKKQQVSEFSK